MHSSEPNGNGNGVRPQPPRRAEQIDRLILDLQCALDRKRTGPTAAGDSEAEQNEALLHRAVRAETLCQEEQHLNRQLCAALRDILDACEGPATRTAEAATVGRLARDALAHARYVALGHAWWLYDEGDGVFSPLPGKQAPR